MNTAWSSRAVSFAWLMVWSAVLSGWPSAHAEPTIISTVPANGASGVPGTATVVFTFSEAMNPDETDALFFDQEFNLLNTTPAWSAGNTVLTCTPVPAFPGNKLISWSVAGESAGGDFLGGLPFGSFTTGTGGGGGGGGSGTNAITGFVLGKTHYYNQTSAAAPALDLELPYAFNALTTLSSNRSATNIQLTLPTAGVSNLLQNPFAPEFFSLFGFNTNLSAFDIAFPSGTYTFTVRAVTSNQSVQVVFPAALVQPGAPRVTNYAAAQAVNAAQPFVLGWDAFPGGTSTDYVHVAIGEVYGSADIGQPGALTGTARTFAIPANTLQPNTTYDSSLTFYRFVATTNSTNYTTTVYRATYTEFTLIATGSATSALVLTNATYTPANFSFHVLGSTGQDVTVEYKTNLSSATWLKLLTTNSPVSPFRAVAPQATTNRTMFFRARYGL